MIRVLMIVPNLRVSNGVASYAMNYYRKLDRDQFSVDFVTFRNIESPYINEIESNGDHVYALPSIRKINKHLSACRKILNDNEYDIIHDNSLMITYPIMRMAKKRVSIRILHSHSARLGETRRNERRNKLFIPLLLKTVNCFAACSSKAGVALFSNKQFQVIPNVIDVGRFRFDAEIREKIRDSENCRNKYIVATVGRLTDAKNPLFALKVMDEVLSERPDMEYWWIGSGALDSMVDEAVSKMINGNRVRLFGSRSDVSMFYQGMDLFFLPSKHEGFGLACIEAQTAGLPCVVSDALVPEIDITGNVAFVPLTSPRSEWVSKILEKSKVSVDRNLAYGKISSSVYSSEQSGKALESYYKELILNNNAEMQK